MSPLINLAILFSTIVLLLFATETTFRFIYDPELKLSAEQIWVAQNYGKPSDESMFTEFAGIEFRTETLPEDIHEMHWRRILFLGDSFTYGSGIDNNESRFSNIVERELNEELSHNQEQPRVHIFNASNAGSSARHWLATLKAVAPEYQPQHVFAIFFLRDGAPFATSLKFNRRNIEPIQRKYAEMPLYGRSSLLTYFYDRFAWKEYTSEFKTMLLSAYLGTPQERSKWVSQQKALIEISNECKKIEASFHLVIFPMLFDLKGYQFHDVEDEIARFAKQNDIAVFSLTPGFIGEEDSRLWVASNNQHPNEKGHRIAAATLLPLVRDVYKSHQ